MHAFDEQFFDAFAQSAKAVLYIKDKEGNILDVNDKLASLYNKTRDELIGHNESEFFPKEEADKVATNDRKVLDSGKMLTFREESAISGENRLYLSYKFPLSNYQGHDVVLAGITIDITEQS